MPVIRRRYNYGSVTLGPHIIDGHVLLCGRTVPVRLRNDSINIYFEGFIDISELDPSYHKVKIESVMAFSPASRFDATSSYYCSNTVMLGAYCSKMNVVYLVLAHGYPIAWCDIHQIKNPAEAG